MNKFYQFSVNSKGEIYMKKFHDIVIKAENLSRIADALEKAQERAIVRKIDTMDVFNAAHELEEMLKGVRIEDRRGAEVKVCFHSYHYNGSYKYANESTCLYLRCSGRDWTIKSIQRTAIEPQKFFFITIPAALAVGLVSRDLKAPRYMVNFKVEKL